jgi:hypothetical protein
MDIKEIVTRVNKLDNKEKLHILNILKTHKVDFTKNANGYFFNLTNVDESIVSKVVKTLELIETNRDLIRKIDKRREELLAYYKKLIGEKIENKIKQRNEEYNDKLLLRDVQTTIDFTFEKILKYANADNVGDPDDMIKEYNKSLLRYEKSNVYYNIITKIKAYNSNNNKNFDKKNKERNNNYDHISDYDCNDDGYDYDIMDIEDDYEDIDDLDEIRDIRDNDNDNDNDNDEEIDEEVDEDTYYSDDKMNEDNENDNENENDNDNDNEIDNENNDNGESEMETNINFYKNLLNKKGFSFDDNKKCFLGYQEYIH